MKKKFDIYIKRAEGGFTYEFTLWIEDTGRADLNEMRAIRQFKDLIRADQRPECASYYYQASESTNPLTIK